MKRRKPDVLIVLAVATGLGVLVTGYAQSLFQPAPATEALQQINDNARKVGSGNQELSAKRGSLAGHEMDSL